MRSPLGRVTASVVLIVALAAWASCSGNATTGSSVPSPLPSGSLGVVEPSAVRTAVEGICEMAAKDAADRTAANSVFYDRVHEELHVIAAAVQPRNTDVAAALLQAKERIESDLAGTQLPASFADDMDALLGATGNALRTLDLEVPACP